ncbi:hypothetical protein M406DRAFT_52414 [Cryphonectria parasitica EP155]|uniref:NADPH-dependent FMN reductase-like domain-containing protein n=1 Tax=Cryphonectria parasitica (strain ATCC 38755 / EP155) TaxID=660469 RepID=A0A9P4YAV1_CRYP1|nr:uncharacterized protein M406DRAFT_52414 [Cryphonectria parasitica EP155]KAF3769275.1 hypothetical protein M406DRAFT_52414 [Cryphonectria parasitica EP155]
MTSKAKSVALVVTSHRALRIGPSVGAVIQKIIQPAASTANITLKTLDVKSFHLPIFSGPAPPKFMAAKGVQFEEEAARAWADEMASHDGYIFVINEYNYGMSGATKNAVDFLWAGFTGKPVMIVSYGGAGGRLANQQLSAVLAGMELKVVEKKIELTWSGGRGPDALLAVTEGKLGEKSVEEWLSTRATDVLEAFAGLESKLREDAPPQVQAS